ncbi:hypothetical protein WBG99_25410 [Streptomyces sp. TG1A-60]|uniref:hypothetical protein n=1 Tax=Streptomyces sp. TG1A-60 TaxID=3129111 RepID=UPI0030CE187B
MTDDVTRGEDIRGRHEARETHGRRDGMKGSGTAPGTRATDTTTSAGAAGTRATVVPGHDTEAGRKDQATPTPAGSRTGPQQNGSSTGTPLLPHDECDKLDLRLQHAVGEFVDGPRSAVEEADQVLEEVAARVTDAVSQRRRTLRASWQTTADDRPASSDTEQLRLALRDYRELTERLLRL